MLIYYKTKITVINEVSIFNDNNKDIKKVDIMIQTKNYEIPLIINSKKVNISNFCWKIILIRLLLYILKE